MCSVLLSKALGVQSRLINQEQKGKILFITQPVAIHVLMVDTKENNLCITGPALLYSL